MSREIPTGFKLPPIVKPEEAYRLDITEQAKAEKMVQNINGQLKNMTPGEPKKIAVFERENSPVYRLVLNHFRQVWSVREADRWQEDPRDPRDCGGIYWEFSAPGQIDRDPGERGA